MRSVTTVIAINCLFFMNKITDLNNLYKAYCESKKGKDWKPQVQLYQMNYLTKIVQTSNSLANHTYKAKHGAEFIVHERGKARNIRSNPFSDRVIRRDLCENVLIPQLKPYLIYDNGASLPGKGISFTRHRFEQHLHEYYRKYHSNEGYVLLIDFSKYYDNIRHDKLRHEIKKHIKDPEVLWLYDKVLDNFKVDVSYLDDKTYKNCLNLKFNGGKQAKLPKKYLTGKKFMAKSLAIGDQVSQISSIYFPTRIDNYCKIVRSIRWYGRYMDDSYVISKDKQFLHEIMAKITEIAHGLGIFINHKKTKIVKMNHTFTWLKLRYRMTASGHLVKKINPKTVTRERRKLKKYRKLYDKKQIELEDIQNSFKSWICNYDKLLSYHSKQNMKALYKDLFER